MWTLKVKKKKKNLCQKWNILTFNAWHTRCKRPGALYTKYNFIANTSSVQSAANILMMIWNRGCKYNRIGLKIHSHISPLLTFWGQKTNLTTDQKRLLALMTNFSIPQLCTRNTLLHNYTFSSTPQTGSYGLRYLLNVYETHSSCTGSVGILQMFHICIQQENKTAYRTSREHHTPEVL